MKELFVKHKKKIIITASVIILQVIDGHFDLKFTAFDGQNAIEKSKIERSPIISFTSSATCSKSSSFV